MSGRLASPLSLDRIARAVRDVLDHRRSSPGTAASAPVVAEPLEPGRLLSGQADLQFLDTFAVSGNRYDVNFEHDAPGRQSGPLAPLTWGEYGTANYRTGLDWQHQVGSPDLPGGLLMRAKVGTSYWVGMAAPNDGFAPDPGPGGAVAVEFDVDPVLAAPGYNPSQSAWAGVKLGSAEPGRKVNDADGFGLLLRGSGGFQAFDGSASVASGRYAAATPAEDRSYHLRIEVASADPSGHPDGPNRNCTDARRDRAVVGRQRRRRGRLRGRALARRRVRLAARRHARCRRDRPHRPPVAVRHASVLPRPRRRRGSRTIAPPGPRSPPPAPTPPRSSGCPRPTCRPKWLPTAGSRWHGPTSRPARRASPSTGRTARTDRSSPSGTSPPTRPSFTDTTVSPGIGYAYAVRAQPSTADLLQATVGSPAPQGGGASSGGPSGIGGMSAASGPIGYATAHETAPYHARFDSSFGSRPEWDVPDAEHPGILMPGDSSTLRLGDLPEHEELGLGMKFYPGELVGAAMPVGSQSKFTVKAGGTLLYRLIATAAPGEWEYGSANNYTNDITFEEEFHDSASEGQGPAGTDGLFVRLPHTGKSLTVTFQAEGGGGGAPAEFAPGATALGWVGVVVPPCDRVTLSAQQKSVLERIMYDAIEDASLAAATAASPINTGSDREDLNTKGPRFGATLLEGQADGTWDLGMEVMKSSVGVLAGQIGGLIDKLMDGVGTFEELEPHVRQQIEEILDRDFFFVQNTRSLQLGNPNYSATLEAYVQPLHRQSVRPHPRIHR